MGHCLTMKLSATLLLAVGTKARFARRAAAHDNFDLLDDAFGSAVDNAGTFDDMNFFDDGADEYDSEDQLDIMSAVDVAAEIAEELANEFMDRLDDNVSQMAFGLYGDSDDGDFEDDSDDLSDSILPIDNLGMVFNQLADRDNYGDDSYDEDEDDSDDFFTNQRDEELPSNFLSFDEGLGSQLYNVEDNEDADADRDRVLDLIDELGMSPDNTPSPKSGKKLRRQKM